MGQFVSAARNAWELNPESDNSHWLTPSELDFAEEMANMILKRCGLK